ncbi:MAG: hypothetical protein ICV66_14420, partial [Chitinophagaceae bacterium]|nr:hypothetical protein [Chitinophagaceae bacterium]
YSTDNIKWLSYMEGNNANAKEWPIETSKKVNARYLRATIINTMDKERVGLWEVNIY